MPEPVVKTSISFTPDSALGQLHATADDLAPFSHRLAEVVARYALILRRDLPVLAPHEWRALIGAHWSHQFNEIDYRSALLRVNVEDSSPAEWEDWGITPDGVRALSAKLKALTVGQQHAVISKIIELQETGEVSAFLDTLGAARSGGD